MVCAAVLPDPVCRNCGINRRTRSGCVGASAPAIRELLLQCAGELGLLEDGVSRERVTFASRVAEDAVIERVLDIVLVERRIAGRTPPFEAVEARIAEHFAKRVQQRAMQQHAQLIARQAGMTDGQLGATTSPLVQ